MAIYGADHALDAVNGGGWVYGDRQRDYANNFVIPELLAANADQRTRALYNDLQSPAAIMQQLKEAGLSPSVYAAKAAGGSVPSGSQGHGSSSNTGGTQQMLGIMSAMKEIASVSAGIAKTKAETGLIKAQTEKTHEEIPNVKKQGKLIDSQIINTYASAGLKNAQEALTKVDTALQQVSLNIASATEATQIQGVIDTMTSAFYESVIAQHEAERRGLLYKKESALFETEIATKIAEYENLLMDLSVKSAGIELSQAQAHSLLQHVAIDWYNAGTNRMNAHTQYESLQAQVKQWAEQNNINLKELDRKKTEMWIDGACRIVGTLGNVACAALGAKSISNNQVTSKTMSEMQYRNQDGTINTVRQTKYHR